MVAVRSFGKGPKKTKFAFFRSEVFQLLLLLQLLFSWQWEGQFLNRFAKTDVTRVNDFILFGNFVLEIENLEENCIHEAFLYSVEKIHGTLNGAKATDIIK